MISALGGALVERLKAALGPEINVISLNDAFLAPTRPLKRPEVVVAYAGGDSGKHGAAIDRVQQEQMQSWMMIVRWRPHLESTGFELLDAVKGAVIGFKPKFAAKPFTHIADSHPDFEDNLIVYSLTFSVAVYLVELKEADLLPLTKRFKFDRDGGSVIVEKP